MPLQTVRYEQSGIIIKIGGPLYPSGKQRTAVCLCDNILFDPVSVYASATAEAKASRAASSCRALLKDRTVSRT